MKRPATKSRKSSSLRTSFGPPATDSNDAEDLEPSGVITPKRGNTSRLAVHKHAPKRSSLLAPQLPTRETSQEPDDARPTYNAETLRALKDSTPSTPRDLKIAPETGAAATTALDLSSKFGSSLAKYQANRSSSAIPSAAEIAEKKARRARLAKEHAAEEYISLDPGDPDLDRSDAEDEDENVMRDDMGRLVLKPKDKWGMEESRLVKEDEDIMENFEDFTEDGRVVLGRNAEAEARRRRKEEMARLIDEAEGRANEDGSDGEEDEETRVRNEAFEQAQTRSGMIGGGNDKSKDPYADQRPRTPPTISPLPTLDGVLERLRKQLGDMQTSRATKLQEMEALQREKIRLGEEEVRIQKALKETAEKFRVLREEKGIAQPGADERPALAAIEDAPPARMDTSPDGEEEDDYDDEEPRGGLGMGRPGAGLGFSV